MVIFHSYVSLPEGILDFSHFFICEGHFESPLASGFTFSGLTSCQKNCLAMNRKLILLVCLVVVVEKTSVSIMVMSKIDKNWHYTLDTNYSSESHVFVKTNGWSCCCLVSSRSLHVANSSNKTTSITLCLQNENKRLEPPPVVGSYIAARWTQSLYAVNSSRYCCQCRKLDHSCVR